MNYTEALEYIHSINWTFCKPGLERIEKLCAALGNPEKKLKFVHVAGTNGKGSFCSMLDSVLRAAGYKVGLYTSPYIKVFNERMRVNGENISNEALARITEKVRPIADSMEDKPTEFELITAIAFLYFAEENCEVVVLEAGMGGRLVIKILTECMEKARALKEIILQPQSELHLVRQFLIDTGFHIIQEDMVKDNGKFYPAMRVVWREEKAQSLSEEELWYGPLLLKEKHPVLREYLENEKAKYAQIAEDIVKRGNNTDKETEDTIQKRRSLIDSALTCFK